MGGEKLGGIRDEKEAEEEREEGKKRNEVVPMKEKLLPNITFFLANNRSKPEVLSLFRLTPVPKKSLNGIHTSLYTNIYAH
jgi:hypothetical protein